MVKLQRASQARTHTSLVFWKEGISTALGFGSQGVNCKLTLYIEWLHSTQNTWNSMLSCTTERDRQWEHHRKWTEDDRWLTRDEIWRRVRTPTVAISFEPRGLTWSYSDAPGYSGQPRNSSAITQPSDHMSMASQNGKPRIISGALVKKKKTNFKSLFFPVKHPKHR